MTLRPLLVLVFLVSASAGWACARQIPRESMRGREQVDASDVAAPLLDDAGASRDQDGGLDPAVAAAAANAVVPQQAARVVTPPPLPRTAAPPSTPPVATPGASQTLVPVVPRGGTEPVLVPAQTPLGVPARPATDGGAR